jgi:hypothetical protein
MHPDQYAHIYRTHINALISSGNVPHNRLFMGRSRRSCLFAVMSLFVFDSLFSSFMDWAGPVFRFCMHGGFGCCRALMSLYARRSTYMWDMPPPNMTDKKAPSGDLSTRPAHSLDACTCNIPQPFACITYTCLSTSHT